MFDRWHASQPYEDDEEHLARRYPKLWHRFGRLMRSLLRR